MVLKGKHAMQFISKFCVVAVLFAVCGCRTPPEIKTVEKVVERTVRVDMPVEVIDTRMPLTLSVWDRLRNGMENVSSDIKKFQFILSGRITLEREHIKQNDGSDGGGRVKFENVHTQEVITIPDQVEGQALDYREEADGEIILGVCFEKDNEYTLTFSCKKENENGYFYLKIGKASASPLRGEEKGIILYGGQEYKVKYNGTPPNLFIKLSQSDIDKSDNRTLQGRKIE
jgi:hypothetical protein